MIVLESAQVELQIQGPFPFPVYPPFPLWTPITSEWTDRGGFIPPLVGEFRMTQLALEAEEALPLEKSETFV